MKNKTIVRICNGIGAILLLCFVVKTITDYAQYSSAFHSAPFSAWILVNALYFVLPALLVFLVGVVIKKKKL